jgi:hypothetical protein
MVTITDNRTPEQIRREVRWANIELFIGVLWFVLLVGLAWYRFPQIIGGLTFEFGLVLGLTLGLVRSHLDGWLRKKSGEELINRRDRRKS